MENNFAIPLQSELTPGDGSCLAHALVDQMSLDPLLRLNRLDHQQFRKYVVNSLPQMITSGIITIWNSNSMDGKCISTEFIFGFCFS